MEQFKIAKIQKQKTKLKLFFSDSSILTVMPIIKEYFNLYASKEIDEKTIDEIISNVIEYCDSKHYGFNRIIKMLKDREISLNKINEVIKDDTRERKEALEQTKRLVKRYKRKNTVNLKRSVYSALIRYGFDENIASLESSKVFNSSSNELNMLKLDYSKLVSRYSRKLKGKELYNKVVTALLSKGYRINDINKIIKEEYKYEMD